MVDVINMKLKKTKYIYIYMQIQYLNNKSELHTKYQYRTSGHGVLNKDISRI